VVWAINPETLKPFSSKPRQCWRSAVAGFVSKPETLLPFQPRKLYFSTQAANVRAAVHNAGTSCASLNEPVRLTAY